MIHTFLTLPSSSHTLRSINVQAVLNLSLNQDILQDISDDVQLKLKMFVGGKFKPKKTVFEDLKELDVEVPEEDRYDPYFSVFDFEAMAVKVPKGTVVQGKTLHATHVPATVSICSNVPGHEEPAHLQTDGDPQKLVDDFVDVLLEHQNTRVGFLTQKYESVLNQLQERIDECKEFLGIEDEPKTVF